MDELSPGQAQIHDLLFEDKLSWQAIIYDLINTEQLDPWDIDITILANRFLEKVRTLEEANFFISSKVLFAASLMLRIKSEILLNKYIPSLDDILFGKKETNTYVQERIELDEDIPGLIPRTPLPRFRKVTLEELMSALGKAINTETRRIRKEIIIRQQERETDLVIPKRAFNLQESIKNVYSKLKQVFESTEESLAFSKLIEDNPKDKIAVFVSLLHLDNQQKVWLEQHGHLQEIWILLKEIHESKNKDKLEKIRAEIAALEEEHVSEVSEEDWNKYEDKEEHEDKTITGFSQNIVREIDED